jgi:protein SCO1/2
MMKEAMALLGDDAARVQVLFVSVDPERDTPELLAQYVPAFDSAFLGLYTDPEKTAALAREFKVFYQKQAGSSPSTYTVDHTAGTYAYDPQGRLRLYIRHGETPRNVADDLKLLLAGK